MSLELPAALNFLVKKDDSRRELLGRDMPPLERVSLSNIDIVDIEDTFLEPPGNLDERGEVMFPGTGDMIPGAMVIFKLADVLKLVGTETDSGCRLGVFERLGRG